MQGARGKNDFQGVFDFFEWSAAYYMTPTEVIKALKSFHFKGKRIQQVNVIGFARLTDALTLYERITNAGIELGDGWWSEGTPGYYSRLNEVKVPWEAEVCEPIQFVFEDGTTFEILPIGNGGARIAENSIPGGLVEGLNHSNFDSNRFFAETIGRVIENIEIIAESTVTDRYCRGKKSKYNEARTNYRFVIEFDESPYQMELEQAWCSRYLIKAGSPYRLFSGNTIPYSRVKESLIEKDQICIVNGRDGGGTFWIVPLNSNEGEDGNDRFWVDNYGMSVEDNELFHYVGKLLKQYFDPAIQNKELNDYDGLQFDGYGVNYYSFDSMKRLLDDISCRITILENDPEDPAAYPIREEIWRYDNIGKLQDELSENEIKERKRKSLEKAIDFYKRFLKRMTAMMKLPGNDMISFAGP